MVAAGFPGLYPAVHLFLEFLADFEKGQFLVSDSYLFPRLWISTRVVSVFLYRERSKAPHLDPLAIDKSPGHGFKNQIDDFLDLRRGRSASLARSTKRSDLFMTDSLNGSSFCFVYRLLQRLRCSKAGHITCGYFNLCLGLRINPSHEPSCERRGRYPGPQRGFYRSFSSMNREWLSQKRQEPQRLPSW